MARESGWPLAANQTFQRTVRDMKTGWHNRPDNWPATLQIGAALACQLPAALCLAGGHNPPALILAATGFALWCWLGRNTRGFPFLFDLLGMQVLLVSITIAVIALVRIVRLLLT